MKKIIIKILLALLKMLNHRVLTSLEKKKVIVDKTCAELCKMLENGDLVVVKEDGKLVVKNKED